MPNVLFDVPAEEWSLRKGVIFHENQSCVMASMFPSIQQAIDTVNGAGGGTVLLDNTQMLLADTIVLKSNVLLMGAGYNSVLFVTNGINKAAITIENGTSNCAVRNLRIHGNGIAQSQSVHGIDIRGVDGLDIDNVWIHDTAHYGIGITSGTNKNVQINGTKIWNTGGDGIDIKNTNDNNEAIFLSNIRCRTWGTKISSTLQAAIDCRGVVHLSNIWFSEPSKNDACGIRFSQGIANDPDGIGGHRSTLTGFNGHMGSITGTTACGLYVGSRDVAVSNGYIAGGFNGVVVTDGSFRASSVTVEATGGAGWIIDNAGIGGNSAALTACSAKSCGNDGIRIESMDVQLTNFDSAGNSGWGARVLSTAARTIFVAGKFTSNTLGEISDLGTDTITIMNGGSGGGSGGIDLTALNAAISAAQNAANIAQAEADLANARLASIANDNILDRVEKFNVVSEYQKIINDRDGIVDQANRYSIVTEKNNYTDSIVQLTGYLLSLSPAYDDTGADTPIIGTVFRQKFADVYTTKQLLLNKIAEIGNYSAYLTNESVVLYANSAGVVSSFAPASGSFIVRDGSTVITSGVSYSVFTTTGVTASISASGVYSVTAMSGNFGSTTLRAVVGDQMFEKVFSVTKAIAGAQGSPGTAGLPGTPGANGQTFYTWYAYADSADGVVNFTTGAPGSRVFQGIAQNKITAVEGTNAADYTWSAYVGPPNFGLAGANGGEVAGAKLVRRSGAAWEAQVYSTESYVNGAFLSFKLEQNGDGDYGGIFVGLNTDPTASGWQSLDYAIHAESVTGNLSVAESGTLIPVGTFQPTDTFAIQYDGYNIRYYKNGVVIRTSTSGTAIRFFLDSAMSSILAGTHATITSWAAAGAVGPQGLPGTQGLPGAPGANGTTLYAWYAYADSVDGVVNFTTGAPGTRTYQGVAVNKSGPVESTDPVDYTWSRYVGPPNFGLAAANGGEVSGAKIIKRSGANWDAQVYSTESYIGGAFISFKLELNGSGGYGGVMVGLNTDPTASDWVTLDHAIYPEGGTTGGTLFVAESGGLINSGTWVSTDSFSVHYDGGTVRYAKNGTVFRTVSVSSGIRFFLDSAMSSNGVCATITSWSSAGTVGSNGTSALSGYLTNESVSLFAYANGGVVSYGPATGSFKIFSGSTDVSSQFTLTQVSNPQGLTVGFSNQTYTVSGGLDSNEDTATLTIRATGNVGGSYAGIVIDKVFSIAKSRGGYEILSNLPANNDPSNFNGRVVYNAADGKLYRFTGSPGSGGGWTSSVPSADIAGQIIEAQIANAAIGASKLKIGVGSNMLSGATIGTNPNRFLGPGWNPDGATFSQGLGGNVLSPNFGSNFPGNNEWTTLDGGTFAIHQPNATPNSTNGAGITDFWFKYPTNVSGAESADWPVEEGKTYEFSVYTGAHRCTVSLLIVWLNSATQQVMSTSSVLSNASELQGGVSLASYKRLTVRSVAPAGATKAWLVLRKGHTTIGQSDSWMFLNRPMWAETVAGASETLPYNPPPAGIINAEVLVSNSILTRHLQADLIEAQHLKANIIVASKVAVINKDAIDPDPNFQDKAWWGWGNDSNFQTVNQENPAQPYKFTRVIGGMSTTRDYYSPYIPIESGAYYRTKLRIFISSDAAGVFAPTWHWPGITWNTPAPTTDAGGYPVINCATTSIPKGQWVTYTHVGQFNSQGTTAMQHRMYTQLTAGYVEFAWEITRAMNAELVVDGAITAGKIAANAVTANTIEAGAVTAAKLNVTELSAITANIGLLRTASSGARTEMENNIIRIYDASNVLRVRLGIW